MSETVCSIASFPLGRRAGKIRDVARKLQSKRTERHALSYRAQVTDALVRQLDRTGLSETEKNRQLADFWQAVHLELVRIQYQHRDHGGAA